MCHSSMIVNGKELTQKSEVLRAGVIPYTVKDNRLHFLLGIDRRTRELTDFGGGVKSGESVLDAALRELNEESCKIFGDTITVNMLSDAPAITNITRNAAIFFVRVENSWLDTAEQTFYKYQQQLNDIKKHNELIGVKWVDDSNFRVIAFNRRSQCMWKRVQNILRWNTNWNELKLTLLLGPELTAAVRKSWKYIMDTPPARGNLQVASLCS